MNNREKATKAIRAWQARHKTEMDSDPAWAAQNLAGDLYSAGLLAQDPPSMADVDWSDEEHYLAGAYDYDGNEVVMLSEVDGNIRVCDADNLGVKFVTALEHPTNLTPNGKRYTLTTLEELHEQEERARAARHTEPLFTAGDYEDASIGTIAACAEQPPYVKLGKNKWVDSFGDAYSDEGMGGTRRNVLRNGW